MSVLKGLGSTDNKGLISAIMPVHNTPGIFLKESIESVLAQTYWNFELIIIDNGSKKTVSDICDLYACQDSRVSVIHQENRGVSGARNRGLESVNGEYVTFIDSDDLLDMNAWEKVIAEMDKQDVSCAVFGWQNKKEERSTTIRIVENTTILSNLQVIEAIAIDDMKYGGGYPWNKIWKIDDKREIQNRFDEDIFVYEDKLWVIGELKYVHNVLLLPDILYTYRIYQGSLTNRNIQGRMLNLLEAQWKILDCIKMIDQKIYVRVLQEYFRCTYFELRRQTGMRRREQSSVMIKALGKYLKRLSKRIRIRDLDKTRYKIACVLFRIL